MRPLGSGNGNVTALVNADSGAIEASYEYSPFGELLRAAGDYASTNAFRFSTKWQDDETDLIYYGYRYYSARDGRFINRDPVEESGGLNLYGFCGNDGVNQWDYLGQSWFTKLLKKGRELFHKSIRMVMPIKALRDMDRRFERWEDNHQREIAMVAVAVLSFYTGGLAANLATSWGWGGAASATFAGGVAGFTGGAAGTALNGGSLGDVLRGGLIGGVTGAVMAYGMYRA